MKKFCLIVSVVLLASAAQSQSSREDRLQRKEAKKNRISELIRQSEEGVLVFERQSIFGIQLRTNGYGVFYELGFMKTNRKTNIFRIDVAEVKHPREEKLFGGSFPFGSPFVYGKINYFYPVSLGFGQQYILGQKGNKNGVAVSAIYNAGLTLGLLRPYYITIEDATRNPKTIRFTESDSTEFLGGPFLSRGGFGKGWSEIKVKPGAFAKLAMRFDWGRFNETVSGMEIGLSADYYTDDIPILLFQNDKKLFFQGHLAILFGRRK
ncbi:MAG: hypothetical protein ABWZ25_02695 [Chitinophagaceae bacterium]